MKGTKKSNGDRNDEKMGKEYGKKEEKEGTKGIKGKEERE